MYESVMYESFLHGLRGSLLRTHQRASFLVPDVSACALCRVGGAFHPNLIPGDICARAAVAQLRRSAAVHSRSDCSHFVGHSKNAELGAQSQPLIHVRPDYNVYYVRNTACAGLQDFPLDTIVCVKTSLDI